MRRGKLLLQGADAIEALKHIRTVRAYCERTLRSTQLLTKRVHAAGSHAEVQHVFLQRSHIRGKILACASGGV